MTRHLFLVPFILLLCATTLLAQSQKKPNLSIWWEISTQKVMRNSKPNRRAFPVKLEASKNEHEAAQIVLQSDKSVSVKVTASDLYAGKNKIQSEAVQLLQVGYVPIKATSGNESKDPGDWPDPLPAIKGDIQIAAGVNTPIWYEIKVPKNIPAGIYKGSIIVTGDGIDKVVPITLTVWDFTMPDVPHQQSAFAIWYDQIKAYYQNIPEDKWTAVKDKYYWFQAEYWLPTDDLPVDIYSPQAAKYLDNPLAVSYRIPFDNSNVVGLKNATDYLKSHGWLDKGYIYTIDEPAPDKFSEVLNVGKKIYSVDPKLRYLMTARPQEKLFGEGSPNLWCPDIQDVTKEAVANRQKAGDEVWWYTCISPKYPFPTHLIDDRAICPRILPWMQTTYRVTGTLYWATNIWLKYSSEKNAYERDAGPWKDPMRFPGGNGDGFLIYPSEDGTYDPVPSIRLKMIRDGMEDWEYLYLLRSKLADVKKKLDFKEYDPWKRNDEICSRNINSLTDFDRDPNHLYQTRRLLADEILQTDQEPLILLESDPAENAATRKNTAVFWGKTRPNTELTMNDQKVTVDKNGEFRTEATLVPGKNHFRFTATLQDKKKVLSRNIFMGKPKTYYIPVPRPGRTVNAAYLKFNTNFPDIKTVEISGTPVTNFFEYSKKTLFKEQTTAYLGYDSQALYVVLKCKSQYPSQLKATRTERDSDIWSDDCVEILLDPLHNYVDFLHFAVNLSNVQFDEKGSSIGGLDSSWNTQFETKTQKDPDGWTAYFKIPFSSIRETPQKGDVWGINLIRNHYGYMSGISTLNSTDRIHDPITYAKIVFK